jgi:RNA polymerase sigma-70 factor, ECF subfamily
MVVPPVLNMQKDEAFENLLQSHINLLYRVAHRMSGHADIAEDLVGTALLQAWKHRDRIDCSFLRPWLIKVVRNEFLMMRRTVAPMPYPEAMEDWLTDASADIERKMSQTLSMESLDWGLRKLSEEMRTVITLCDIEEIPYDQVAEILGIPRGTIASRLHRARKALRNLLAHHAVF